MIGKTNVLISLDASFSSPERFQRFLNRKPHWVTCTFVGADSSSSHYRINIECSLRNAKRKDFWDSLQDALRGNAYCWDNHGSMSINIGDIVGNKNGAFTKFLYLLYKIAPSQASIIFGRSLRMPMVVANLTQDLSLFGIYSPYCSDIKKLIGRKIAGNIGEDIDASCGRITLNIFRSTMNSDRLAGIFEFLDLACRFSKNTSWNNLISLRFVEYVNQRVKSNFLKQIF